MSIRKGTTIIAGNSSPLDWTGTLQEYNIALENGTIKENMVCYITDDTLYTDDIRPEIETLNNIKANKDLSNLSEVGEKHFLNKSQITNCITEIPQRIKYTLVDGVLTLLAGSELIIPSKFEEDGTTPKFDYVTINENLDVIQNTTGSTKQALLFVDADGKLWLMRSELCFSGETKPTVDNAWMVWYDTTNHVINLYASLTDHNTVTTTLSLPFAIATPKGDGTYHFTSIDQVFNGLGYIGSTVWVDKGVKGLMPNGRNEDGTLNNLEFTTSRIAMRHYAVTEYTYFEQMFAIDSELGMGESTLVELDYIPTSFLGNHMNWVLHTPTNIVYQWNGTAYTPKDIPLCIIGDKVTITNGIIKSLQPKLPFRAIDYSDKSEVSGWGMPSGRGVNLTLGASESTYTAPANGWFSCRINSSTVVSNFLQLANTSKWWITTQSWTSGTHQDLQVYLPASKGDVVRVVYNDKNNGVDFRFIYAQGEV